jgi:hypothetical protein
LKRRATTAALLVLCGVGCRSLFKLDEAREQEPLPVKAVEEPIVVAAWAEPSSLPEGGGQAQILVRVQKKGGSPFRGVEVRLATSTGSLFSGGRVLITDGRGMTRDRLTTRRSARVVLNAGGTRYRFDVRVGDSVDMSRPARGQSPGPDAADASPRGGGTS